MDYLNKAKTLIAHKTRYTNKQQTPLLFVRLSNLSLLSPNIALLNSKEEIVVSTTLFEKSNFNLIKIYNLSIIWRTHSKN